MQNYCKNDSPYLTFLQARVIVERMYMERPGALKGAFG
jgi:hypothetical protein